MRWLQTILFFALIYCNTIFVSAQISVDETKTDKELVENILLNSDCASVDLVLATGDNLTLGKKSYGYFKNGGGSFPFTEGVILSTWSIENAAGPVLLNPFTGYSNLGGGEFAWQGDADLDDILGITSKNATILEFDFSPLTNFLSFDYIFASNEYKAKKPCDFSDGFAFLIKEKGSTDDYKNLAVIPGTDKPVSSTNVRPAILPSGTNAGCAAEHQDYFKGFNDNTSPINYAGQTVIMNAQTTVEAGKTYHIKLVIADAVNQYVDSAVFLKAGSFSPKINLGPDQSICFGESYRIDTNLDGSLGYSYKWYKDGSSSALTETTPFLNVTVPGTYKVEVTCALNCTAIDEIKVDFYPEVVVAPAPLNRCDDGGNEIYDLTKADATITASDTNLKVDYYKSQLEAKGDIDRILNPTAYLNNPAIPELYARVTNTSTNCVNYTTVQLDVKINSDALLNAITDYKVSDFSGSENSILLELANSINYEYSLDGIVYQDSPLFSKIAPGKYSAYARDKNSCEISGPTEIYVLDYPRFFTPNGDGSNDVWKIKNLDLFPNASVIIYNRYGKLLQEINAVNPSWNGTYQENDLPADDYWFTLIFGNGKIIKEHFTLKR
jgi:gliding motility-associated-like protein